MAQQPAQKSTLREQMVQQAQPRPRSTRRIAPDDLSASSVAWPAPITHVSIKEIVPQKENGHVAPQEHQPAQNLASRPAFPERELRVKVWEQERNNPPLPESGNEIPQISVENIPTSPLAAPEQTRLGNERTSTQNDMDKHRDDVEHLDTIPLPNYAPTPPLASQQPMRSAHSTHGNTPLQPIRPPQMSQPSYAQEKRMPVATPTLPTVARRQKSRIPFIILLSVLCMLILGSGLWIILTQPFTVPTVTQPLQDFKDTHLGIALSYPTSWSTQHNAAGVLFADSSHTALVKLIVADASSDAAQYLQQQATKNGMTAIKPLEVRSFAGTSWQQIQGNIQQDGASYTTTMFATVHHSHTYVLTQMAPQSVYADEESVVFSAIRNSFKFL
ncbi:MAG: hypothetical protein NVS4B11_04320 [Ktedonobacteraceae bacterium]